MSDVMGAIRSTVPISRFNKGLAGKIFTEVRRTGPKVVMKNNVAECVASCSRRRSTSVLWTR